MSKHDKKSTLKNDHWPNDFIFSDFFSQFIEPLPEAVIFSNPAGKIIQINQEACRLFGYTREELLNLIIENLVPVPFKVKHSAYCNSFFDNPRPRYMNSRQAISFLHKKGHEVPMEAALFCIMSDEGPIAVNLIRDVSEQKSYINKLVEYGLYDELTSLHNRRYIMEELKILLAQARRRNETVGFFFIDLDKFKPVNDRYGHEFGDALLVEVGKRLKKTLRESDFFGRLGGDEFYVVQYPFKDNRSATVLANKILRSLKQPILIKDVTLEITVSVGIASTTESFFDIKELINQADRAMYQAKRQGSNQFVFADGFV